MTLEIGNCLFLFGTSSLQTEGSGNDIMRIKFQHSGGRSGTVYVEKSVNVTQ